MTTQQPLHGHVLGALVQGMLFCAIREGIEPVSLLEAAGLTLAEIEPLDVPIHHTKVLALYREIRLRRPDLELGLMLGMSLSPDRMAMLGHAIAHAPTFGAALRDFMRFQKMLNGGVVTWSLTKSAGLASIHLTSQADLVDIPCVLEAPLAMVVMLARKLTGHTIVPQTVSFCHGSTGDGSKHRAFFGVPVRFLAPTNELVFASSVLDLPVLNGDNAHYSHLIDHMASRLNVTSQPQTTSDMVHHYILRTIGTQAPRKTSVARGLGMSARTLLRRLHDEGTTFESIMEQTRRNLSVEYLSDRTMAITDVATRLGYAEPSSFFRAFARWFGCTPSEYRSAEPFKQSDSLSTPTLRGRSSEDS